MSPTVLEIITEAVADVFYDEMNVPEEIDFKAFYSDLKAELQGTVSLLWEEALSLLEEYEEGLCD